MSAIPIGGGNDGAGVARVASDWLGLAAAPAFVTMALMTFCLGGEAQPLCLASGHAAFMSGMVPMYFMMGTLHSAPWLRLIAGWRN